MGICTSHSETMTNEAKIALITGGCQGIGRGIARALLDRGAKFIRLLANNLHALDIDSRVAEKAWAKVAVLDISETAGDEFISECRKENRDSRCLFIKCDVTDKSKLKGAFDKAKAHFGALHIICNNAGIDDFGNEFDKVINLNVAATIQGTLLGIEYLSKSKGGHGGLIVNMSSMAGVVPAPISPIYSATKSAVIAFTRAMKGVHTAQGVRVNCLCPVFVQTGMLEKFVCKGGERAQMMVDFVGVVTVDTVVEGFLKLLDDESIDGDVLAVSAKHGTNLLNFSYEARK